MRHTCTDAISRSAARLRIAVSVAVLACLVGGCARGGLTITNTSDTEKTFTTKVEGGEKSWTLKPGSSLTLGPGAVLRTTDYAVTAN